MPSVEKDLVRERVLVMSFERGLSVTQVKEMNSQGYDLRKVAKLVSEAFNTMIFKEGFVHADPHPGNLFIRKMPGNDNEVQLVLLDHGIYTTLSEHTRLNYTELWRSILTQNDDQMKKASIELGVKLYELFVSMVT